MSAMEWERREELLHAKIAHLLIAVEELTAEIAEFRRQAEYYRQTSEILLERSIPASEGLLEGWLCLMRRVTDAQAGDGTTHAKQ